MISAPKHSVCCTFCYLYLAPTPPARHSRLATPNVARVQCHIANVILVQNPAQVALDTEAEAAVRARAHLAQIVVPIVGLRIEALMLEN